MIGFILALAFGSITDWLFAAYFDFRNEIIEIVEQSKTLSNITKKLIQALNHDPIMAWLRKKNTI